MVFYFEGQDIWNSLVHYVVWSGILARENNINYLD